MEFGERSQSLAAMSFKGFGRRPWLRVPWCSGRAGGHRACRNCGEYSLARIER